MDKRRFILYLLHMGLMLIIVSVHHTIPTLPVGAGKTLAIFKTNQLALLSTECPHIFSS